MSVTRSTARRPHLRLVPAGGEPPEAPRPAIADRGWQPVVLAGGRAGAQSDAALPGAAVQPFPRQIPQPVIEAPAPPLSRRRRLALTLAFPFVIVATLALRTAIAATSLARLGGILLRPRRGG